MTDHRLTIALSGNPNSGKTTIFNALTSSRRHVGNYPGVTVEKTQGYADTADGRVTVVDLPGTYSLTATSLEEVVARNYIIEERPDAVIDIVDASNLERNLYLATQLIELGTPLVLALNKSDLARSAGAQIDYPMLSELLGVPMVPTVGHKQRGTGELLEKAISVARDGPAAVARQRRPHYGGEIEPHLRELQRRIAREAPLEPRQRWFAIKLLEGDTETERRIAQLCPEASEEILAQADRIASHIEKVCGDSRELILADRRYGFISGACAQAVQLGAEARHARSDKIDAVLTNRFVGLPIFAAAMYAVFQLTFAVGNPLVGVLDRGKEALAEVVRSWAPQGGSLLVSLLADGVIEGVGAVLSFVPLIALLYLAIAVLEDSGYMARAAFILDKLMHRLGLHGKSFIPMLIGFGCTVPAVMATRILESRRDRLTTMMVLPLMSCGARLPVYVLLLGAFFRPRVLARPFGLFEITNQAVILMSIYVLGVVLAVVCIKILRMTILRGEVTPFVMELPPYRVPALRGLLVHAWERTREYIRKAGTIILAIIIVLWALKTWPQLPPARRQRIAAQARASGENPQSAVRQAELTHSAIGRLGHGIAPLLRPCGFDWRISTGLVGAMAAKEAFIGQMGVIYAVDSEEGKVRTLREKLAGQYTPLEGLAIMVFILISTPCVATVAVTIRESGSWKWAAFQWGYLTALAWVVTAALYQIGRTVGFGATMTAP